MNTTSIWCVLVGLIFEIVGATLIAGNVLASKHKNISHLKIKQDLMDLALSDANKDTLLVFLGTWGTLFLITGFTLQFIATLVLLNISMWLLTVIVFISITIIMGVLVYFASQTPEQTLSQKIRIISKNTFRFTLAPILSVCWGKKYNMCDICFRPAKITDGEVCWQQIDGSDHSITQPPYTFLYGHTLCIDKDVLHKEWPQTVQKIIMRKEKARSFVEKDVPVIKKWYEEYRKCLEDKSKKPLGRLYEEAQFLRLEGKLARVF